MTRANVLWLGTLALLVAGLAIDRYSTKHQLKDLEHKYRVMAEAAARVAEEGSAVPEQRLFHDEAPNAVPVTPRAAAPGPSPRQTVKPAASPSSLEGDPPSPRDEAARIDAVFSDEHPDQRWSRDSEGKLTSALLPFAVDGSRIQQVECRSTLCKVRAEHASEQGFHNFMDHAFAQASYWQGAMFSMREPDSSQGTVANVIYFSKEGRGMPSLQD
jgi:hypothetical protein